MPKYKIAVSLAASLGLHKTVGRALISELEKLSDYECKIYFSVFDEALMEQQIETMIADGADAIVTIGRRFTLKVHEAVQQGDKKVPAVVFTAVKHPIDLGLIESFRRPAGHLTGVVRQGASPYKPADMLLRMPELGVKKVVIPYASGIEIGYLLDQMRAIKRHLERNQEISVELVGIASIEDAAATVRPYLEEGTDMVMFLEGSMFGGALMPLSALCQEHGVYLFGDGPEAIKAGADFGYGGGNEIFATKAVRMLRKICEQGAQPATMSLTVVANNRSYWINTRLLDRDIVTRDRAKELARELETKVQFLDTQPEDIRR